MGGEFYGPTDYELGYDPYQDYKQDSFAQGMNGNPFGNLFGPQNTPALSRYQDYLGNTPTREAYQPNLMGKILASIAGLSAGIKDPAAGIRTSMGIMDIPYQRALEQYRIEEPGLRQSASIEERQLNDKNTALKQFMAQDQLRSERQMKEQQFGQEMQFKYADLEQRKSEALSRAGSAEEVARINHAYDAAKIRVDEESNRIREMEAQNRQYGSMEDYIRNSKFGEQEDKPNTSFVNAQVRAAINMHPDIAKALEDRTALDPDQEDILSRIYEQYGLR